MNFKSDLNSDGIWFPNWKAEKDTKHIVLVAQSAKNFFIYLFFNKFQSELSRFM